MPVENITGFRLSPQQKHLWLLQQVSPDLPRRARCAVVVNGSLETAILKRALQNVVRQHEILRTNFLCLPEMTIPAQVISDDWSLSLVEHDLGEWQSHDQESRVETLYQEMRDIECDFEHGTVLSVALITLSELKHIMLFSLPTLCADQATLKNIVREVNRHYTACLNRDASAAEPMQYLVASEWLNELLESEEAEVGRDYWRKNDFSTALAVKLPGERERSASSDYRVIESVINGESKERIEALVQTYETSLQTFLLACWQTLLWRLTQQTAIAVGRAFDGRTDEDLEETLGLLEKYLPVQIQFEKELRFSEVLTRVDFADGGASEWQECFSWSQITDLDEKSSGPPFCPICFEFDEQTARYTAPNVVFSIDKLESLTDKFKLKLNCVVKEDRIITNFHFDAAAFERDDIQRLSEEFHTLLTSAFQNPEEAINRLEILSLAEREQILLGFNQTTVDYPVNKNLHELIEGQAERTPAAIAVVFEAQRLTYGELNARANQLAHYLRRQGVGVEQVVGVLMERSLEMVVALLGILKAGAAYLPLDPTYPHERLSLMLEDASPTLLISHQPVADTLSPLLADTSATTASRHPALLLDQEWAEVATEPSAAPALQLAGENLAYVIYTSGSTGTPKAVMISHQAIRNHMLWMQQQFPLQPEDAVLQKTPFSFDASVWEFYAPLLVGARLVVARAGGHQEAAYLVEVMERERVSRVQAVPTLLRMLVEGEGLSRCGELREVFSGGEVLSRELAWRVLAAAGGVRLWNLYGPTEATIDATWQAVERVEAAGERGAGGEAGAAAAGGGAGGAGERAGENVEIGRPIANTQVYVLDEGMGVVPIGVVGEMYIGGEGLARGYLNRAELTAEKFVPHPYSREGGQRLYRTGDLVKWNAGGEVEFVGRADAQVKVRGYRIELGEIEAVLSRYPGVRECVIAVLEQVASDKKLVAYVVGRGDVTLDSGELRGFLKDKLPDYMIPFAFQTIDKMPLTPSGKIDRRALPALDPLYLTLDAGYQAPRTPTEEILAGIWSELLGVWRIGLNDNFFELGGHSLLATQVVTRVRDTFGQEVALRSLFETPTIAGLAQTIETARRAGNGLDAAPIRRVPRDSDLPLSFAQQRLWFLDQLEPNNAFYNISGAVRLEGKLKVDLLERTFTEIVRRHEVLRTTFTLLEEQPVQVIAEPSPFTLRLTDLSTLPPSDWPAETQRRAAAEAHLPFDLAVGPLLRTQVLRFSESEHVLLLTMHHIVSDGWSIGVLIREVAALYKAFINGEESPLEELPVQYADFSYWQREWLQGQVLQAQLHYWRGELADAPTVLELPTDHPRPPLQSYRGAHHSLSLSPELSAQLRELSRRHGTTLFMTLLAAFDLLLSRYSGQGQVLVGTPIANRNRSETEALIGFFVNTLVLRGDLRGNPTFRELLHRVRESALGGYAHQDLPFEKLVEELQPERDMSRSPLFQVMFVLQNAPQEALELPGLRLSGVGGSGETAKFELTLGLEEREGVIVGGVEYNRDLYEEETVERMARQYERVLAAVVREVEVRVGEVAMLSEEERDQLLSQWNETRREYEGAEGTIHELIEGQAERTPAAIAVVFDDERLTYGELNARANQLAHYLRRQGVGVEQVVGVLMERSLEMVVALLGILKAGAAYLPLDPTYPQERLGYMLSDGGVRVVLTQGPVWREKESELGAAVEQVVRVEEQWAEVAGESRERVESGVRGENLAYVIYTSGSTGNPKGAMNTHRAIHNRLLWMQEAYHLTSDDCVLQKTPFSFDVSVWEFFWPLMTGSRLVMAIPNGHLDSAYLIELIRSEQITTLHFVPSMLQAFLEETGVGRCQSLRRVVCSGETLSVGLQQRFFERVENCELHNLYGPTEAAVDVTSWQCRIEDESRTVPIGKPIANLRIYLLDSRQQPVPVGVVGELHIAGMGLGRGYLQRPELTAERFIPDSLGGEAGSRLYRSGDLARYMGDGNIEFLGRVDHQVKVRGVRIELGEIEGALNEHPGIRASVVVVQADHRGEKRLVAYVVGEEKVASSELRRYLRERLPESMIPQGFVQMERLPLTSSGKIDRRGLPERKAIGEATAEYEAPRNEVEGEIASIWGSVLGVERVGIHDNFFDLGGHSMLAIHVHRKLRAALKRELSVVDMFRYPTVDSLAAYLTRNVEPTTYEQVHDRVRKQLEVIGQQRQMRARKRIHE